MLVHLLLKSVRTRVLFIRIYIHKTVSSEQSSAQKRESVKETYLILLHSSLLYYCVCKNLAAVYIYFSTLLTNTIHLIPVFPKIIFLKTLVRRTFVIKMTVKYLLPCPLILIEPSMNKFTTCAYSLPSYAILKHKNVTNMAAVAWQ